MSFSSVEKKIIFIAAIPFLIAAVFKEGFYHADEHLQIIEWAWAYVQGIGYDHLPWEYEAQIRPNFQTFLAAGFIKVSHFVGIENPHIITLFTRFFSAGLSFFALLKLYYALKENFHGLSEKVISSVFFFLWLIPVLSVRFSSEILSGSLFILGVSMLLSKSTNRSKHLWIGLLFGFAFISRFQMGLCILGVMIWMMIDHNWKHFLKWIPGVLLSLVILLVCDYTIYEEFVFSPWKYLEVNLIEGKSSSFGTKPFYHYFHQIFLKSNHLLGVVILLGLVALLVKKRGHILNFIIWPFLLVHILIPHKEVRFLFPLIFILPWLLLELYSMVNVSKGRSIVIGLLVILNFIYLIPALFIPAGDGEICLLRSVQNKFSQDEKQISCSPETYGELWELDLPFYMTLSFDKENLIIEPLVINKKKSVIVTHKELKEKLKANYKLLGSSTPIWTARPKQIYRGRKFKMFYLIEIN